MYSIHHKRRAEALVATAVLSVGVAVALVGSGAAASAAPAPRAHQITVSPDVAKAGKINDASTFSCQSRPIDGSQGARCYSPQEIEKAYSIAPLISAGLNGRGKTIVIVDAYSNPYIATDLSIFDQTFNLPAPNFSVIAPDGMTPFNQNDPEQVGWAEEISLDVQWAHAAAPGANIVLDLAKSPSDVDLLSATRYAIVNKIGDVISQSFGEAESCVDPTLLSQQHALFRTAVNEGITLFASSGDSGASQFNCAGTGAILSASSPASDPDVTAVGGTTLSADNSGSYLGETAWTEPLSGCNPPATDSSDINCSGGGVTTIYPRPTYQNGASTATGRSVPDVSYDAGVNGGVLTHIGVANVAYGYQATDPIFFLSGGTSAGSPQWAGIAAIADQFNRKDLGNINPQLYKLAANAQKPAFHDVTTGNNDVEEIGGQGYNAGTGYDLVTGLGTPNANRIVPGLRFG